MNVRIVPTSTPRLHPSKSLPTSYSWSCSQSIQCDITSVTEIASLNNLRLSVEGEVSVSMHTYMDALRRSLMFQLFRSPDIYAIINIFSRTQNSRIWWRWDIFCQHFAFSENYYLPACNEIVWQIFTDVSDEPAAQIFTSYYEDKKSDSFGMLVITHQTIRCHIWQDTYIVNAVRIWNIESRFPIVWISVQCLTP
jgi:hypothetical protein